MWFSNVLAIAGEEETPWEGWENGRACSCALCQSILMHTPFIEYQEISSWVLQKRAPWKVYGAPFAVRNCWKYMYLCPLSGGSSGCCKKLLEICSKVA